MNVIISDIKDAIRFAFSDLKTVLFVGIVLCIISLLNKKVNLDDFDFAVRIIFNLLSFYITGYGSYVTLKTIQENDKPPKIGHFRKLTWEGFKKTAIVAIYGIFLSYLFHLGKIHLSDNLLLASVFFALFIVLYAILITALLNRYQHKGSFFQAFNFKKIFSLFKLFDLENFILLFLAAITSQLIIFTCYIDFSPNLTSIEMIHALLMVILAPFILLFCKRLIGLRSKKLLHNVSNWIEDND
ncbi:DUF4013 domain-containing protein [Methanobrevibacter sp.]|uniref:DUF4013 domain-containing protein n=1 Tax=Methanobrevibacter sp. TaxID=66852 RepID=UPI00388F5507